MSQHTDRYHVDNLIADCEGSESTPYTVIDRFYQEYSTPWKRFVVTTKQQWHAYTDLHVQWFWRWIIPWKFKWAAFEIDPAYILGHITAFLLIAAPVVEIVWNLV